MKMFDKTKQTKRNEKFEKEEFSFPDNVSMKNIGDEISGVYQGLIIKPGEGLNGGDLILAGFTNENILTTCVAGSQAISFLESFTQGYWLKMIRKETRKLKDERPFAIYKFEFDPAGLKQENQIVFIDAGELPDKPKVLKP